MKRALIIRPPGGGVPTVIIRLSSIELVSRNGGVLNILTSGGEWYALNCADAEEAGQILDVYLSWLDEPESV